MTKKDPENNLDTNSGKVVSDDASVSGQQKDQCEQQNIPGRTEVKNAHASGNGSIGRSNEDIAANESNTETSGF